MELGNAVEFFEHKTILVTGAAGFLAKVFIEKILRTQPNVKKLYLLLRATDNHSALQRFNSEVIAKELFNVVKEKLGSNLNGIIQNKIKVVAGDVTFENLGIQDKSLLEEMKSEVEIVVNLAAITNFYERYDISFGTNTMGAKNVLIFAKSCEKLKLLLHVSTAYVSGEKEGMIMENPYKMGETLNGSKGLDIDTERKLLDETLRHLRDSSSSHQATTSAMKELGIQRANKFGWPNTYVFTKAMGEMLLGHLRGNVPLVIVRPTIITSTYKQPFPGWVEGFRSVDSVSISYAKGKVRYFAGDNKTIVDLIPADMVVNTMMIAMVAHADKWNENGEIIYQSGSSLSNPVTLGVVWSFFIRYFTKHPLINKGKPIKVGKPTFFQTMKSFKRFMGIRYLLPLKGLKIVNSALCQLFQGLYQESDRKIKFVMMMTNIYGPYVFFKGVFDDMNTERLLKEVRERGMENEFYFDPRVIDWEDYFMNTHMPGAVKYVFK